MALYMLMKQQRYGVERYQTESLKELSLKY